VFEKIIEYKSNQRGQLEYLVKYVDKPLDEASWVKESHFTSTDLIEEYWSTQKNEDVLFLTKFTSSKTSVSSFHYPFSWFICFLFLLFFPVVSTQRLTGQFQLCDTTDKIMIKIQLDCENKEFQNLTVDPEQESWHIFLKKISISGDAYICKMFLIRAVTNTFFFGLIGLNRLLPNNIEMVQNRMCDKSRMTCTSDTCTYETNPKPEYEWMREIITSVINCFTQRIEINAFNETATPFEGIKGKCPISDMYCILINGIIIWSDAVIHRCPLRYIESSFFFSKEIKFCILLQKSTQAFRPLLQIYYFR
jgi:hypothetical protein